MDNVQKHNNCKEFAVSLNFGKIYHLMLWAQNVE
jgi:hypothetical protein